MSTAEKNASWVTQWRPRFSVRDLLLMTLVIALVAGYLLERRRVQQAEAVLIANGLKWELAPLEAGKFRVTVLQRLGTRQSDVAALAVRVQSMTAGTLVTSEMGQQRSTTGLGVENSDEALYSGKVLLLADQMVVQGVTQQKLVVEAQSNGASATVTSTGTPDKAGPMEDRVRILVRNGVYDCGSIVPLWELDGHVYELTVK